MTISPAAGFDHAKLGDKAGAALLRHDQHFAVGIVEDPIGHRRVGGIEVHRHADLGRYIAVAAERHDALDEIGRLARNRKRRPAQLRRRRFGLVERRAADQTVVDARIRPMHHRGLNAIGPGAAIFGAGGGERGAGNLLGIKPERRPLRRITADRQGAGHRLGQKMIAEAGLIIERYGGIDAFAAAGLDRGAGFFGVFDGWCHTNLPRACGVIFIRATIGPRCN